MKVDRSCRCDERKTRDGVGPPTAHHHRRCAEALAVGDPAVILDKPRVALERLELAPLLGKPIVNRVKSSRIAFVPDEICDRVTRHATSFKEVACRVTR